MQLFRQAGNGRRGDAALRGRLAAIGRELEALWDRRRLERAGRLEGIDLLVHRAYAQTYGPRYEEVISPQTVGEPADGVAEAAA